MSSQQANGTAMYETSPVGGAVRVKITPLPPCMGASVAAHQLLTRDSCLDKSLVPCRAVQCTECSPRRASGMIQQIGLTLSEIQSIVSAWNTNAD
jgi:hypothetical protein